MSVLGLGAFVHVSVNVRLTKSLWGGNLGIFNIVVISYVSLSVYMSVCYSFITKSHHDDTWVYIEVNHVNGKPTILQTI